MNIKKNTMKTTICIIASLIMLLMANLGLLAIINTNQIDSVSAAGQNMIQVSIDNATFKNNTRSTYPFAPSSYDAYNYNSKVSSSENKNVTAGVVKLDHEDYENKFATAIRGTGFDKYVLMIDSSVEQDGQTVLNPANFGYRTMEAIKMSANSHYMVSVDVFTLQNSGIGSLYLYDENNESKVFSKIENINSHSKWTTYTFFVSTSSENLNLKLGMYLKGAGTVLFDNLACHQLNSNQLSILKSATKADRYVYTNVVDNLIKEYTIENTAFVYGNEVHELDENGADGHTASIQTVYNTDGKNLKAIKISIDDDKKSFVTYSTDKNFLTFAQNSLTKVTVTLKAENLSGNANLQLVQTNVDDEDKINSAVLKITSNTATESNVTNDYKQYSFYVLGHPTQDSTYQLVIGLGDKDTLSSGDIYISSIATSKINYKEYTSTTTGTTAEKIDLTKNETYSNSSIYLDNANFNSIEIEDYNAQWPAKPTAWSVTTGAGTQKYGVINPSVVDLSKLGLSLPINPFASGEDDNNNILMMYNASNDTLSYTSATKTLSADSYHCFTTRIQTQNSIAKLSLVTTKNDQEIELMSKHVTTNTQEWKNISLYVHTGHEELKVSLKITLETTAGCGYAYVDDTSFDYLIAPTKEEFDVIANKVDNGLFAVKDLTNVYTTSNSQQWATPDFFQGAQDEGVTYGIVNANGDNLETEVVANAEDVEMFKKINSANIVGIRSTRDTAYTIKSKLGYKLTANSFYRITVQVFTQNISSSNIALDASQIGAQIKLTNFNESFKNITSNGVWSEYKFFIKPTDDTTTEIEFSLGNSTNNCKGDAFFGNLTFEKIEENEYNLAAASERTLVLNKTTEPKTDDSTTNTDTANNENSLNNNAWIYAIPSLLFAVSIIIAVVWVLARKIKFKKPTKKNKTTYDRNRTVSKQILMRKATVARENKIIELNKQLDELNAQRATYEDEYKHDLSKLRDMKIHRANPQDIAKLEKDMKKNQRLSASIGMSINKINNDLSYMQTDAYMNSLMKKIASEPVKIENKSEE